MRLMPTIAPLQNPPAPPTLPEAPVAPVQVTGSDPIAAPAYTQAYVDALNAKKDVLSTQLRSAQGRRNDVARDLHNAPDGPARTGLEQRLQVLDTRLAQLETDIAANGRQLAAAPANLLAASSTEAPGQRYGPFSSGQLTGMSIVFIVLVMAPLAFAAARTMLRRAAQPKPSPQLLESAARLERMEQAVDTIAVEIERISEGQRFVTGLLAKRSDPVPVLRERSAESVLP